MTVHNSAHGQPAIAIRHCPRWVGWRREQLVNAGFDELSAARLASAHDVDVHELLDLVARGCPPPLAVRIAAPLIDHDRQANR